MCVLAILLEQLNREIELADDHPPQALCEGLMRAQRRQAISRALSSSGASLSLRFGEQSHPHADDHEGRAEWRHNGAMSRMRLAPAPWWTVRRAANRKPATYRCPICGHHLPALSEHMLIAPEGDSQRRRHAHTACVMRARAAGKLVLRDEWLRTQPRPARWWRRLWRRAGSRAPG